MKTGNIMYLAIPWRMSRSIPTSSVLKIFQQILLMQRMTQELLSINIKLCSRIKHLSQNIPHFLCVWCSNTNLF